MLRVEHAASERIPASSRGTGTGAGLTCAPQAFELSQRPWANTFLAALTSRSWAAPQWQVILTVWLGPTRTAWVGPGAETGFWDDQGRPAPWPDDIDEWTPATGERATRQPGQQPF